MSYVLSRFRRKTHENILHEKKISIPLFTGVPRETPQEVKFFPWLASTENMKPQPSQRIFLKTIIFLTVLVRDCQKTT